MQSVPEAFSILPRQDNSPEGQAMADFMQRYTENRKDPAADSPGASPLYGEQVVPHVMAFQSLIGTFSRSYLNPDEAVQDSVENANLMVRDVGILECLDNRRRQTALLPWEIQPEDKKCIYQVSLAEALTKMVSRIRRFTEYRMWLNMAMWNGRSGIQHTYGWENINGRQRCIPKPKHRDHYGWMPINGDKLVFRYHESYKRDTEPNAYPHQCGIRISHTYAGSERLGRKYEVTPVGDGLAVFLKPWERDTMIIHKHFIEDADYHHSHFAGSVHGIGIRSKIYWEWWLKQEAMAFLMQYLERSSGGTEIYTYPAGDMEAKKAVQQAAQEKAANGRNIIFFPRPIGEDAPLYDYNVVETGMQGLDIIKDLVERYFGGRIKRYILGQVLTTEAESTGMGSGVADAHLDTLQQIVLYDAANLEETIGEELVRYLQILNFPETRGWHMKFKLKTDDDDAQARLESFNSAYQMGARIREKDVFDVLGIGTPQSGDRVLEQAAGGMMPGMMPPGMGDGDGDGRVGAAEEMDDNFTPLSEIPPPKTQLA